MGPVACEFRGSLVSGAGDEVVTINRLIENAIVISIELFIFIFIRLLVFYVVIGVVFVVRAWMKLVKSS